MRNQTLITEDEIMGGGKEIIRKRKEQVWEDTQCIKKSKAWKDGMMVSYTLFFFFFILWFVCRFVYFLFLFLSICLDRSVFLQLFWVCVTVPLSFLNFLFLEEYTTHPKESKIRTVKIIHGLMWGIMCSKGIRKGSSGWEQTWFSDRDFTMELVK